MPDHGHQRADAGTTGDQKQRATDGNVPHEVAPDRASELELVTYGKLVDEVRRDLAALDSLDSKRT